MSYLRTKRLHCKDCDHEWDGWSLDEKCDWCGGDCYLLDDEPTPEGRRLIDALLRPKNGPIAK